MLLVALFFCTGLRAQKIAISGYVKQLGTYNYINQAFLAPYQSNPFLRPFLALYPKHSQNYQIHNRLNFAWYGKKGFSAGAGLRNRLFWGFTPKNYAENKALYAITGINSYSDLIEFDNYFDLSVLWWQNEQTVFHSVIDRLWLQWAHKKWRLRLGRQRINWGINTAFNPNDIFNQYNFFDFDYEERPGADAVLAQYFVNAMSSIEVAFTPGVDSTNQSVGAVLYRLNKWKYDWQVLAGYFKCDFAVGLGWAGNLKNAGFKGEITLFQPLDASKTEANTAASLAIDYNFKKGIYVLGGYIFNKLGETSAGAEAQLGLAGTQLSAKNIFPYKHTFMLTAGYNLTALLRFDVTWLQTSDFKNVIAVPQLSYSLGANLDLLLLGQLYFANHPTTYSLGFFNASTFGRIKYSF